MLSRNMQVDAAKGLAICLVVMGHSIQYQTADFDQNEVFNLIYAVHMPLFFFLSGYLAKATQTTGHFIKNLRKKFKSLIIPFLFWLPLSYLSIRFVQQPQAEIGSFSEFLMRVLLNPDAGGLWFLLVLFECHIAFSAASCFLARRPIIATLALVGVLNIAIATVPDVNILGLGLLRWYLLFFCVGCWWRQKHFEYNLHDAWPVLLLFFAALAAGWSRKSALPLQWFGIGSPTMGWRYYVQAYHLMTALLGIFGVMGLIAWLQQFGLWNRSLASLGKSSLEIYSGHYLFLYLAVAAVSQVRVDLWVGVPVVFICSISGALIFSVLLKPLSTVRALAYGH